MAIQKRPNIDLSKPSTKHVSLANRTDRNTVTLWYLTGRSLQVVNHLLNSLAVRDHGDWWSLDDLAKRLGTTPARLRLSLRQAVDAGLIEIEGEAPATVRPTVKL